MLRAHGLKLTGPVEWYWRLFAFLSSWLILGGFLALTPLTAVPTSNNQPTIPTAALTVLTTTLLAAGFALTPLLVFATVTHADFHLTGVYLPALSSTSLGALAHILTTSLNPAYSIHSTPGIVGAVTGVTASSVYALLALYTRSAAAQAHALRRRDRHHSSDQTPLTQYANPPAGVASGSASTHSTSYHGAYPDTSTYIDPGGSLEAPVQIIHRAPTFNTSAYDLAEEELTRRQMLALLEHGERGRGPLANSQATFRIELPRAKAGSVAGELDLGESRQRETHAGTLGDEEHGPTRRGRESPAPRAAGALLSSATYDQQERRRSREQRRREIEQGVQV